MPRILLIDERSVYRTGLRCLIERNIQHAEIFEASNLPNALSQIRTEGFIELVLVDMDLSRFRSIESLQRACEASPTTRWAIMSSSETRTDILTSLAAGFYGFITKDQSDSEILSAIRDILSGRIYVPFSLAMPRNVSAGGDALRTLPGDANILKLTARQREVLSLIVHGLSNKEIGRALHITEATTKIHAATLLRVLGVRNRTEAAFKAATLIDLINKLELRLDLDPVDTEDDTRVGKIRLTNGT